MTKVTVVTAGAAGADMVQRGSQNRKDFAATLIRMRKNGKSLEWGKPRIYRDPAGQFVSYNFCPSLYGHTWTVTVPAPGCPWEFFLKGGRA